MYEQSAVLIVVQLGKLAIFDSKFETVANLMHLYMSRKWACLALFPFIKSVRLISKLLPRKVKVRDYNRKIFLRSSEVKTLKATWTSDSRAEFCLSAMNHHACISWRALISR
jgi:hypothetical protein